MHVLCVWTFDYDLDKAHIRPIDARKSNTNRSSERQMRGHTGLGSTISRKKARLAAGAAMALALTLASPAVCQQGAMAEEAKQQVAALETSGDILVGYGLIIALPGTGDSAVDEGLVEKSIVGVLKSSGLDLWHGQIEPGRIAKVMVSAELPPNAKHGVPLVISVTALGDATSLAGGTLLAAPLRDSNGKVYVVAQGQIKVEKRVAAVVDQSKRSEIGEHGLAAEGTIVNGGRVLELAAE
jgi:flagellar basal body P-ring protein FlgI